MKRKLFIIFWIFIFLIIAFFAWGGMTYLWMPHEAPVWTYQQGQQWWQLCFCGMIVILGLPAIALILGYKGMLPGTQGTKK